jgi:hypothetical protein
VSYSKLHTIILQSRSGVLQEICVRTDHQLRERAQTGLRASFYLRQIERKKEMRACLSHPTRFAQQRNLNKDWPVFFSGYDKAVVGRFNGWRL